MAWFSEWWLGLGLTGQIMACAAIPMTVVLFLQALLMLFGAGFGGSSDGGLEIDDGGDTTIVPGGSVDAADGAGLGGADGGGIGDHDAGGAGAASGAAHEPGFHHDTHDAARMFTIRGIVAFFAMGGWAGIAALSLGVHTLIAVPIALLVGVGAMMLASALIDFALRMQQSGNISLANAMSGTADVYITIPPGRSGVGKVTMTLQERFVELDAVTDNAEPLKPNTKVEVTGLADEGCLVVEPID
jgi:hypothetical protein